MREIKVKLEVCEQQLAHFRKHGHRYRKQHLIQRAAVARRAGKQDVAQQILQIIDREKQHSGGAFGRHVVRRREGAPHRFKWRAHWIQLWNTTLKKVDEESGQYMRHAERKILTGVCYVD